MSDGSDDKTRNREEILELRLDPRSLVKKGDWEKKSRDDVPETGPPIPENPFLTIQPSNPKEPPAEDSDGSSDES